MFYGVMVIDLGWKLEFRIRVKLFSVLVFVFGRCLRSRMRREEFRVGFFMEVGVVFFFFINLYIVLGLRVIF